MPDQARHDGIGMRSRVRSGMTEERLRVGARNDGKGLFFGFLAAEGGEAEEFVVGGWFDGGGVGLAEFEVEFFVGVAEAAPDGDVVAVVHEGF